MTEQSGLSPVASARSEATGMVTDSLGRCLSEARKERGLTVADVAQVIKYSPRQIESLENDRFDQLPDTAIVRGFIRNYAKLLQVDAANLLAIFNRQAPMLPLGVEVPPTTGATLPQSGWHSDSLTRSLMLWGSVAALVGAAAAYYFWPAATASQQTEGGIASMHPPKEAVAAVPGTGGIFSGKANPEEKNAALRTQPVLSSVPSILSAPPAQIDPEWRQLTFSFDDKSWVEIKDATQRTIFAQSNPPGTRQVVSGKPPFALVVGNASRVQLQYEDRSIDMQPYTKVDVARFNLE